MQQDKALSIHEFLSKEGQIVDLRTPSEFQKGHIPKAINVPIFSDEERKEVGKVFKLQGPFKAMQLGLKSVGPKLSEIVTQLKENKKFPIQVYCSRGGMRSQAMVWLLNFSQMETHFLTAGYKGYRRWVLELFSKNFTFNLLQPFLGDSMQAHLKKLERENEQVLNLEELANYSLDLLSKPSLKQPSTEHFENLLAEKLSRFNFQRPIWVQKVGKNLGECRVPHAMLKHLRASPLYLLDVGREKRIVNVAETLKATDKEKLLLALSFFKKKLGPFKFKALLEALKEQEHMAMAEMLITHFDKVSSFHLKKHRGNLISLEGASL